MMYRGNRWINIRSLNMGHMIMNSDPWNSSIHHMEGVDMLMVSLMMRRLLALYFLLDDWFETRLILNVMEHLKDLISESMHVRVQISFWDFFWIVRVIRFYCILLKLGIYGHLGAFFSFKSYQTNFCNCIKAEIFKLAKFIEIFSDFFWCAIWSFKSYENSSFISFKLLFNFNLLLFNFSLFQNIFNQLILFFHYWN